MKLPVKLSHRAEILLDLFLIFLFTAVLIRPLFKAKFLDHWDSIESTFISDARFLVENWPHPQWQPLWYAGTRFDYVYPPALRYGTAAISKVTGFWPVKAYHFYTAFFYCLGIAGVYLLIRVGTRSRGAAWLGAVATALMSPSYLFMKKFRLDGWEFFPPLRIADLAKYGEGPHMTALALIPFALVFTWLTLERRRPAAIGFAAVFSAAVVSNNFYGATALALFYPILIWSFWITRGEKRILLPAIAVPVLAYGLTAFWLVPSYLQITSDNLKFVSKDGAPWCTWLLIAVTAAFIVTSYRFARGRSHYTWAVFLIGCAVFYSLNVLGNYFFDFRVAGEPMRFVPELDTIYVMGAVTVLLWLWNQPHRGFRIAAAVLTVAPFFTTIAYLQKAWRLFPQSPDYKSRVEYQMQDWFWRNMPDARLYPIGSVRFWFDTWHDLAQLGGGSEQGVLNATIEPAQWENVLAAAAEPSVLWLRCLGVDAVYVSEEPSEEYYKDFHYPRKFAGLLSVLYDDQRGNVIYKVPRRFPARVRVVETARLHFTKPPRFNNDAENLKAYADVIEGGPDSPATLTRNGADAMLVTGNLQPGQTLIVQESYDPAWHAWSNGQSLAVRKDPMGFMSIEAPPGQTQVSLVFVTPLENRIGRIVSLFSLLLIVGLVSSSIRRNAPLRGLRAQSYFGKRPVQLQAVIDTK